MNLQQLSRLFVSVVLFAACVVLALLAQAQSGGGGPAPGTETELQARGLARAGSRTRESPSHMSWAGYRGEGGADHVGGGSDAPEGQRASHSSATFAT